MDKALFLRTSYQMIALVRCALHGTTPPAEWLKRVDTGTLFSVCEKHNLTACAAYALESAGIRDPQFTEAKAKAIRKNILLDAERNRLLAELEAKGIWYMPLKGALIKEWYPKIGMRQMSDNDILFDAAAAPAVRDLMTAAGYRIRYFNEGIVDAYQKEPVYHFEMHRRFFAEHRKPQVLYSYYKNVQERLLPDGQSRFGKRFSDEDFYIYFTAHSYKHYLNGGTGVRSLADTYILMQHFGDTLDRDYLRRELNKLNMADFEERNRKLAMHLFSGKAPLSPEEQQELRFYISSGTYGTVEHSVGHRLHEEANGSKLRYIRQRLFPPLDWIRMCYPFFYRHKILLPYFWFWRLIRRLRLNGRKLRAELQQLRRL